MPDDTHNDTDEDQRFAEDGKFRPGKEINKELKNLYNLDNWHGLLAWLDDVATILAATAVSIAAFQKLPPLLAIAIYIVAAGMIGACQRGLATVLHEASHKTAARNPILNWFLGAPLSGWLILQLYCTYFQSHVQMHHPKLGDAKSDPDIENYLSQRLINQSPDNFVFRNTLALLLGMKTLVQLPYVLRHRLIPADIRTASPKTMFEMCAFVLYWVALVCGLIALGWFDEFVLYWLVPYFTTHQAIGWVIETSEHFPIVFTSRKEVYRTRNRHGNRFEKFFFGRHGEWAHLVHHLRPGIPFWAVDEAHRVLLADPDYRRSTERYAGLFTRVSGDAPTIVKAMSEELQNL